MGKAQRLIEPGGPDSGPPPLRANPALSSPRCTVGGASSRHHFAWDSWFSPRCRWSCFWWFSNWQPLTGVIPDGVVQLMIKPIIKTFQSRPVRIVILILALILLLVRRGSQRVVGPRGIHCSPFPGHADPLAPARAAACDCHRGCHLGVMAIGGGGTTGLAVSRNRLGLGRGQAGLRKAGVGLDRSPLILVLGEPTTGMGLIVSGLPHVIRGLGSPQASQRPGQGLRDPRSNLRDLSGVFGPGSIATKCPFTRLYGDVRNSWRE